MFNNMGRKIKTFGKVMFWISSASSWVGGLLLITESISAGGEKMLYGIIGGLLVAGLGTLIAYLSVMFMVGFGELIESSTENKRINKAILDTMRNKTSTTAPINAPAYPNPYQPNPYQPNPYQPNPYQPNPYQPNPYQPNPYQQPVMQNPAPVVPVAEPVPTPEAATAVEEPVVEAAPVVEEVAAVETVSEPVAEVAAEEAPAALAAEETAPAMPAAEETAPVAE